MAKKNLIGEALIEAAELEKASIDNAKDIILESFTPDFINFFKDVLTEGEDIEDEIEDEEEEELEEGGKPPWLDKDDEDDDEEKEDEIEEGEKPTFKKGVKPTFKKGVKPDFGKGDDDEEDEEEEGILNQQIGNAQAKKMMAKKKNEGNEHDSGKSPDAGRQGTDPAVDDDEEHLNQDMKEGTYDDVSGDATPEKGQAGLPNKPKVKKVGKKGWEKGSPSGVSGDDPEKSPGDMPGKKPSVKQTGDGGWEDEGSAQAATPATREKLQGKKLSEAEDEKEDKESLDVPDDLFDDEEDITEAKKEDKDDGVELKDNFSGDDDDAEIDIDIDVDDDDDISEDVDIDIKDEDEDDDEMPDDEIDENLYIRQEGVFKKISHIEKRERKPH